MAIFASGEKLLQEATDGVYRSLKTFINVDEKVAVLIRPCAYRHSLQRIRFYRATLC